MKGAGWGEVTWVKGQTGFKDRDLTQKRVPDSSCNDSVALQSLSHKQRQKNVESHLLIKLPKKRKVNVRLVFTVGPSPTSCELYLKTKLPFVVAKAIFAITELFTDSRAHESHNMHRGTTGVPSVRALRTQLPPDPGAHLEMQVTYISLSSHSPAQLQSSGRVLWVIIWIVTLELHLLIKDWAVLYTLGLILPGRTNCCLWRWVCILALLGPVANGFSDVSFFPPSKWEQYFEKNHFAVSKLWSKKIHKIWM